MKSVYLLIEHIYRPNPVARTNKPGWHLKENAWNISERVKIVDGSLKSNQLRDPTVIIDLINNSVLKNRSDDTNETLLPFYLDKYKEDIKYSLMAWSAKDPANLAKLREIKDGTETDTN